MFTWDDAKRQANLTKHGVDFAETAHFDFAQAVIKVDGRFEYGEERRFATGPIGTRLHAIVYTMRGPVVRVISLRKANKREVLEWLNNRK